MDDELQVSMLQDPQHDPAFAGKSYREIMQVMRMCLPATPRVRSMLDKLAAFDLSPMAQLHHGGFEMRDAHTGRADSFGACLGNLMREGDSFILDDRQRIMPGDLCAFLYRSGLYGQVKQYLGRWTGGYHPFAGDRQPEFVHVFHQVSPRILLLVHGDDMAAAIRVRSIEHVGGGQVTEWTPFLNDPREDREVAFFLEQIEIEPAELAHASFKEWRKAATAEYRRLSEFLALRFTPNESAALEARYGT